jgi:5'-nucleotidase
MPKKKKPIILFTNDDGIASPGLWTLVKAFEVEGDLLVVAPREQQSGMGRSMPTFSKGTITPTQPPYKIKNCTAYAVDGTPAQSVQHGILELSERLPDLTVSGINYGDNCGNGVTISGTVGAAIEAASFGVPSIAVSLQTPVDLHMTYSKDVDFKVSANITLKFGRWILDKKNLPDDVDLLKIDVPRDATKDTAWRMTRLSRRRVYWPTRPERVAGMNSEGRLGYRFNADPSKAEPDSDVYTMMHDKLISVTPMSLDMSSRVDLFHMKTMMQPELSAKKKK